MILIIEYLCVPSSYADLRTHEDHTYHVLNSVGERLLVANESIMNLNESTLAKLKSSEGKLTDIELNSIVMGVKVENIQKGVRRWDLEVVFVHAKFTIPCTSIMHE